MSIGGLHNVEHGSSWVFNTPLTYGFGLIGVNLDDCEATFRHQDVVQNDIAASQTASQRFDDNHLQCDTTRNDE